MNKRRFMYAFLFAVCFAVFQFAMPVYAADNGGELLAVNAAWLDGDILRINVTDANDVSSALALRLSDYISDAENKEYISIQAIDLEGNKSGVIEIKNPYYVPPVEPSAGNENEPPKSNEPPNSTSTNGNSTEENLNPFTPDGAGTVMDNAADGDGKEFFTIGTDDGDVFYLIVDRQRDSDNVYLLNSVTLNDLVVLAENNEKPLNAGNNGGVSVLPGTEQPNPSQTQPPATTEPKPTTEPLEEKQPDSGNYNMLIFVVIAVLAVGGAGYYFKIVRGKKNLPDIDDDDYDYEDEPEEPDNYDELGGFDSKDGGGDE